MCLSYTVEYLSNHMVFTLLCFYVKFIEKWKLINVPNHDSYLINTLVPFYEKEPFVI